MVTRRDFLERTALVTTGALATGRIGRSAARFFPATGSGPTRGMVPTVLGPIDASKLGFTLPHEHLVSSSAGFWRAWPEFFGGREKFISMAADKLRAAKDEGVDTMVDLTTFDLGRDVRIMQEVSRRSGVQIVACTGHWHDPQLSMGARTVEELTEFFLREIQRGIEDTDIKAGVIKVATDQEGVTPFLEKALRAAARASKATGTPIETHSWALPPNPNGPLQADVFESEGLDPAKVSIGHSDYGDIAYLTGLIDRGFSVGMDHVSRGVLPPGMAAPAGMEPYLWEVKTQRIKALVDAGHANKLLLSNDWLFADSAFATGTLAQLERANPDGILFLTRRVIPYLKQLGVSDAAIHTMTVENPRRFFGGV